MKRFLLLTTLALLVVSCAPKTPAPLGVDAPIDNVPNILGSYALNATDLAGEEYGGTLTITQGEKPNEYKFQWLISGGIQEGTGTLEGNHLTFTWTSLAGTEQEISGVGEYTITVEGQLHGTRTINGFETPGTETAYPNPK
ncbi:MAG: hypothetical protein U0Z26_11885 [Anaerolineales bacterium]